MRTRIIAAMPEILEIIGNENRGPGTGGDGDVRPSLVRSIQRIAETIPPFRVLRGLDRVAKDVKRLELSLKTLPRSDQLSIGVNETLLNSLNKLALDHKVGGDGKTSARRKRLAAEAACDLLLDYGGGGNMPTLTENGPYVRLAALLYKTATGRQGDLERACAEHFKALKADGLDLYARHFRAMGIPPMPADLLPVVERDRAEERQRRQTAARRWRPLQQVLDDLLGK